jgi:geranylgeranyl pyrophosphate synthase
MREGKLTLPALYVLNTFSDESIKELALKIRSLDATSTEIADFIEIIKQNGGIDYAKNFYEMILLNYQLVYEKNGIKIFKRKI